MMIKTILIIAGIIAFLWFCYDGLKNLMNTSDEKSKKTFNEMQQDKIIKTITFIFSPIYIIIWVINRLRK